MFIKLRFWTWLQIFRNGKWVTVNPIPNTFVINMGCLMQAYTNDRYKSALHRAVVNCNKERFSIAVYRYFTYQEYFDKYWGRGLSRERCLVSIHQGRRRPLVSTTSFSTFKSNSSSTANSSVSTTNDVDVDVHRLPSRFIRPIDDRPNLSNVVISDDQASIPLIDLEDLHGPNRSLVVKQIGLACQEYGFFQVKNHGIPQSTPDNMLRKAREFFQLPESERLKSFPDNPSTTTKYCNRFKAVNNEKAANWRDFLRLNLCPLEDFVHEWPSNPPSFREEVGEYCTSTKGLALTLMEAMSESLGLERNCINQQLGKHADCMAINHYAPCPEPELTYGLAGHSDVNLMTLLLQDDVPGLQIFRNGKWVTVNPIPNTFVINMGDLMQAYTNDRYKSVLHRAVVNCNKERFSIATFYSPSPDAVIGPVPELVDDDHPAVYRYFTCHEYFHKYWGRGLSKERCLGMFIA